MSDQPKSAEGDADDLALEIAHLLFIDVVGYSKLLVNEQIDLMQQLNRIVRATASFRRAESAGKLTRLPTGDGMVLLFFRSPEEPVRCALEITEGLRDQPQIKLRIGIHSGPVNQVMDVNDQINMAGAAINIGQRVMDCGDAGHILISKHVADDLNHYAHWRSYLHDLGECEVKHGLRLHVFNLAKDGIGNLRLPDKFRHGRRWKSTRKHRPTAIFGGLAVLLAAVVIGFFAFHRSASGKIDNSIAVLPFLDLSPNRDQEYFSDGLTEQITTSLAQIRGLFVVARTSAFAFKNKTQDIREIGERLHVQNVLEGSVNRSPGQVHVDAKLINAANGYYVWTHVYDSNEQNALSLQNDVAEKVASALRVELHISEAKRLETPATANPEANELYLRGRYLLNNKRTIDSIQKGRTLFEEAVNKDPHFAFGHAGIADAYILLGKIGAIKPDDAASHAWTEVTSALAIDPNLAEGLVTRAILLNDFEWNWPAAEIDYQKALELEPNNADGHHWYARNLAEFGRFDEALREINAAQKQDPLSPTVRASKSKIFLVARRYDRAIEQASSAIDLEQGFAPAYSDLAQAYLFNKQFVEGIDTAKKYLDLSSGNGWARLELAFAYAISGNKSESERIASETAKSGAQFSPYDMATIYAAWGDADNAFLWLRKAIEQRSVDVVWIRVDPRLDNIRSDQRFEGVVKSMVPRKSVTQKSLPAVGPSPLNQLRDQPYAEQNISKPR